MPDSETALRSPSLPGASLRPALLALACALLSCAAPSARPTAPAARDGQWRHDQVKGAVFYEVFVRSYADSDGDGIGDLKGLTSKLDYLRDLGVEGLWLTPIFGSPSYHGYDTTDYENINPAYGTNADFEVLAREAHQRGIRIVLDLVMNHTSSKHPWFVDSASSPTSAHRDWYVWRAEDPGWTQPFGGHHPTWHALNGAWFYGLFWAGMPDLNYRNPAVREEMKRVAALWLKRGADGFRLDAARHLIESGPGEGQAGSPETHAFWKEFSAYVRGLKPEAVLVGENWTETPDIAAYYGSTAKVAGGDELPMNFDFPLAERILRGVRNGEATIIADKLDEVQRLYPPGVVDAPFLTNHDQVRVATELGDDPERLKSAAAVLLTLPGAPFLYYGEELGMQNGPTHNDEAKRTPMAWDGSPGGGFTPGKPWFPFAPGHEAANVAAELREPGSLLACYRELLRVRRGSAALREGGLKLLTPTTGSSPVLAFLRETRGETVLVVHNLGDSTAGAGPWPLPGGALQPLRVPAGVVARRAGDAWSLSLPAHATGIWRIQQAF